MNFRMICLFSILFIVSGCSTTPAPQPYYYRLTDNYSAGRLIVSPDAPTVVIERVILPAFLLQSGLVMQQGANQLLVSRQHIWAESLEEALPRSLQLLLQSKTDNYRISVQGTDYITNSAYSLRLQFDNFQATDDSRAVLSGRYQLIDAGAETEITIRNFSYSLDLLDDGHPHAVTRLQMLLEQLAINILEDLPAL